MADISFCHNTNAFPIVIDQQGRHKKHDTSSYFHTWLMQAYSLDIFCNDSYEVWLLHNGTERTQLGKLVGVVNEWNVIDSKLLELTKTGIISIPVGLPMSFFEWGCVVLFLRIRDRMKIEQHINWWYLPSSENEWGRKGKNHGRNHGFCIKTMHHFPKRSPLSNI
jgi:hypothetical protein